MYTHSLFSLESYPSLFLYSLVYVIQKCRDRNLAKSSFENQLTDALQQQSCNYKLLCLYLMNWCSRPIYFRTYEIDTLFSFTVALFILMTSFGCVIKTELYYDVTHLSQNVLTIVCSVHTQCKSIILTFLVLTNVLLV